MNSDTFTFLPNNSKEERDMLTRIFNDISTYSDTLSEVEVDYNLGIFSFKLNNGDWVSFRPEIIKK